MVEQQEINRTREERRFGLQVPVKNALIWKNWAESWKQNMMIAGYKYLFPLKRSPEGEIYLCTYYKYKSRTYPDF